MIVKSVDFDADFADFNVDFADFDVDFVDFTDFGIKLVKLTFSFHSTVRIQGGNINFFLKICRICKSAKSPSKFTDFAKSTDFHISLSTFKRTTCETKDLRR